MKAPFNVFVIPYFINEDNSVVYAIFKRSDEGYWQFIAGGGENNETAMQTAKRESFEEAGISFESKYRDLNFNELLRVEDVRGYLWGPDVKKIPNHGFAVEVRTKQISLSHEHTDYKWVKFDEALNLLKWEGNKRALTLLNEDLISKLIKN